MFVEFYIYMNNTILKQHDSKTARRNILKLKHSIPIEKIKYLPKWNWQPYLNQKVFFFQGLFGSYIVKKNEITN